MKNLIKVVFIMAIVTVTSYGIYSGQKQDVWSNLTLANLEALANGTEYVVGSWGTNWKTYRIQCTKTAGIDWGIVYTSTYTYWTDACGSGSGSCLYAAGC